jgi:hypothetical protein
MKKIIFYLTLALIFSGCSHRIVRTGYQVNKSDYRDCDIAIQKNMRISGSVQKVGEIKLGETGFSVSCSEADAIQILKNEGCALHADIINITFEKRPDLMSSCYRCTAEFYKYLDPALTVQSDEKYKPENISERTTIDRKRTAGWIIGAIVGGFIFGYLMF